MKKMQLILQSVLITLACILLLADSMAQSREPMLPDPGRPRMSREEQLELGMETAAEVCKQMPVLPDNSPETQYVRKLGSRLAAVIPPETSWPFEFYVVPQKAVNAFALPGGKMFINIGTIIATENEAQLAGVMAHEMAHVYMQHSAKQVEKASLTQGLLGLLGSLLGSNKSTWESIVATGLKGGAGMVLLKYSRSDETQADEVGAIILYKAGYNPQSMVDFTRTLQEHGGSIPQFLSSHPNPGNREGAIQNVIREWPAKTYRTSSAEFTRVHQHASGVKAYTAEELEAGEKTGQWESLNRKNGVIFNSSATGNASPTASAGTSTAGNPVRLKDVRPNSKMVTCDCTVLKMLRPDNWDVMFPQQRGQSLTIAPRAGLVSNGFGYGVAINGITGLRRNATIDQATTMIVNSLQNNNNDLTIADGPDSITVAGVRGRSVIMQSTSPFRNEKGQSQKERDWLVTIPRQDGTVIYLVFVAPESEFKYFRSTFEKMLKSIQF